MFKKVQHIMVLVMLLFGIAPAFAQIAMPDTVCVGTSRLYKVNDPAVPSTYTWKIDGAVQSTTINQINITWNTPGVFLLSVQEHSNNGCDGDIRSGYVYVNAPPVPNAGPDTSICFGSSFRMNGSGGATYKWTPPNNISNTAISNPVFYSPIAGTFVYALSVQDVIGCKSVKNDTVKITVLPQVRIFAGNDTILAINQTAQLNVIDLTGSGFTNYLWSPGFGLNSNSIRNPVARFTSPTDITYTVTARTAGGCIAQDDINIKVFLAADILVPNAFTPNDDKVNDVLRPILIGIKALKHFIVYNRYGQQIYFTSTPREGWDGRVNGMMQNTGNYVWVAEGIDYNGNTISRKGFAVLIK
jgi:gliding motility-associated-like protein